MDYLILVINPGSTSTKLAIYENEKEVVRKTLKHPDDVVQKPLFPEQYECRKKNILDFLEENGFNPKNFSAIAARGGRLKPLKAGVYRIDSRMMNDAMIGLQGEHPANISVVLAYELSQTYGIPAFTVDPISVDEMWDVARITGIAGIERRCLSHALNMKAAAKKAAQELKKNYEDCNLIVVHLGGGGSISAHLNGRMVDVYNSDKEGPFAIERAGAIPTLDLLEYMKSRGLDVSQVVRLLSHEGGLYSLFGTRDFEKIEQLASEDPKKQLYLRAYVYNICKYAASFLPIFRGNVDAIVFTGGVCLSKKVRSMIEESLSFAGKLLWYPGEFEMETLALRTLAVLRGEEEILEY